MHPRVGTKMRGLCAAQRGQGAGIKARRIARTKMVHRCGVRVELGRLRIQEPLNCAGGRPAHSGCQMRINVECRPHRAMSQALSYDLDVHTGLQN